MPERPHLRLDFNSPSAPPPSYSPESYNSHSAGYPPSAPPSHYPFKGFTSRSYSSPFTPTRGSFSDSPKMASRRSQDSEDSASEKHGSSSRTPPRIVMGVMVNESDYEEECSLEVPGIVLIEPVQSAPTPRLPPPPRHTVLLAPTSLPLPSPGSPIIGHQSQSSISTKSAHQFSPAFLSFLHGTPDPSLSLTMQQTQNQGRRTRMKAIVLLGVVVIGGWHLWSSLTGENWSGLVEEAAELV